MSKRFDLFAFLFSHDEFCYQTLLYLFSPFFCTNHTTSGGKYICIRCFKFVYDDFDAIFDYVDLEILSL